MIKDFTQTAEQLKELAKILNEFKSETVQLKLLELLFKEADETKPAAVKPVAEVSPTEETVSVKAPVQKGSKRPGRPARQNAEPVKSTRKRSTTRPGPSIILKTLIENNFFTDNRTIGDVVDYCMKMYNYEYKSTDLSGTLAKLAKDGVLKREKNPHTNQFEYNAA